MRIGLVSLDQIWQDKQANFDRCRSIMAIASSYACKLVIFPEMTLTAYSLAMDGVSEVEGQSLTLKWFKDASSELGVASIFGACLSDPETEKPRNTLCLTQPGREPLIVYSKIHPFSFAGEEKVLEAGNRLGVVRVGDLSIGATICYDLRFPELYASMSNQCDAIVNIANWPDRRIMHWRTLLVARAIENQCFMFGVNRVGVDGNGLQYEKSSIVVAPDGELVEPIIPGPELDIYDINRNDVESYRSSFPTLRDKRYGLYSDLMRKMS